jgi:Ca-activated chloride channel homolog
MKISRPRGFGQPLPEGGGCGKKRLPAKSLPQVTDHLTPEGRIKLMHHLKHLRRLAAPLLAALIILPAVASRMADDPVSFIRLFVTVLDKKGQPVEGLSKGDFVLLEEKAKQELELFQPGPTQVSLGLLIDTSGSMRGKMPVAREAAGSFVQRLRDSDEAFVARFKRTPELVADFTNDRAKIGAAVTAVSPEGKTSLLDAISASSAHLLLKGKLPQKALVVFTDGLEKDSSVSEIKLIQDLQKNGTRVFFVAFTDPEMEPRGLFGTPPYERAKSLLSRIAEATGGKAFFLESRREVESSLDQLIRILHQSYVIGYFPTDQALDGKFRSLKIQVRTPDNRKLSVLAQRGYFMPSERK